MRLPFLVLFGNDRCRCYAGIAPGFVKRLYAKARVSCGQHPAAECVICCGGRFLLLGWEEPHFLLSWEALPNRCFLETKSCFIHVYVGVIVGKSCLAFLHPPLFPTPPRTPRPSLSLSLFSPSFFCSLFLEKRILRNTFRVVNSENKSFVFEPPHSLSFTQQVSTSPGPLLG